jgi:hypothetical protein
MKTLGSINLVIILLVCNLSSGQSDATADIEVLRGNWILDMSPENKTDNNFAKMEITEINGSSLNGFFYSDGVKIRQGRINTQTGVIYGALISGDNSGEYNTSFYFKDGTLYGTTHAIGRDFLAVWTATKEE